MLSLPYARRQLRANFCWQERCRNSDSSRRLVTGQFEPIFREKEHVARGDHEDAWAARVLTHRRRCRY
jgi:hypothetical protein